MALPGLEPCDGRLHPAADLVSDFHLVETGTETARSLRQFRIPGKGRAVGTGGGEQRLRIGGERRSEMEDQRAGLTDPVSGRPVAHRDPWSDR